MGPTIAAAYTALEPEGEAAKAAIGLRIVDASTLLSLPLPASLEHIEFGTFVSADIDVALARDALALTCTPDDTRVWPDDRELPIPPFDRAVRGYAGPPLMHVPRPPSLRDLVLMIPHTPLVRVDATTDTRREPEWPSR